MTTGFSWTWTCTSANSGDITLTKGAATSNGAANDFANYVEANAAAKGIYNVKVVETASAAFGGCTDATGQTFKIYAFDKPSFSITTATNAAAPNCGDATNFKFEASLNSSGTPYVKYKIEKYNVTIAPGTGVKSVGAKIGDFVASNLVTFDPATGWDYNVSAPASKTSGDAVVDVKTALNAATQTLGVYNFSHTKTLPQPVDGESPVIIYRFTVEGINGLISRKADYTQKTGTPKLAVADYTLYGTEASVDIYVARAPKTGPVYHIGNNIAK